MILLDATTYANKPDTGIPRLYLTDREFYAPLPGGGWDKRRGDEDRTRAMARAATGSLLCLDIEHLKLDSRTASDAEIEAGIAHIAEIIGWVRDERPGMRLGLYGVMPIFEYWKQDDGWRRANGRLRQSRDDASGRYIAEGLSDLVDVLFPSLYTFYADLPGWEKFAAGMAREARRFGKQACGFMHSRFHPNAQPPELRGTLIPLPFYQRQCEVVAEHFDGLVQWDGWDTVNNRTLAWDAEAAERVEIARRAARVSASGATVGAVKGEKA